MEKELANKRLKDCEIHDELQMVLRILAPCINAVAKRHNELQELFQSPQDEMMLETLCERLDNVSERIRNCMSLVERKPESFECKKADDDDTQQLDCGLHVTGD